MSPEAVAVQTFLAGGGTGWTRLRERPTGDVHDLPAYLGGLAGASLRAQDVVAALEELAKQGVVAPSWAVHGFDSTEYHGYWRLSEVSARGPQGQPLQDSRKPPAPQAPRPTGRNHGPQASK